MKIYLVQVPITDSFMGPTHETLSAHKSLESAQAEARKRQAHTDSFFEGFGSPTYEVTEIELLD